MKWNQITINLIIYIFCSGLIERQCKYNYSEISNSPFPFLKKGLLLKGEHDLHFKYKLNVGIYGLKNQFSFNSRTNEYEWRIKYVANAS